MVISMVAWPMAIMVIVVVMIMIIKPLSSG